MTLGMQSTAVRRLICLLFFMNINWHSQEVCFLGP